MGEAYSVSGHQPRLLGGFTPQVMAALRVLAEGWIAEAGPSKIVSGMAPGWDMAVAEAAVAAGVDLVAVLAWGGQGLDWPPRARAALLRTVAAASAVRTCFSKRSDEMWSLRDRATVDLCGHVVALSSGAPGGTFEAVAYAAERGKVIVNLWDRWPAAMERCKGAK